MHVMGILSPEVGLKPGSTHLTKLTSFYFLKIRMWRCWFTTCMLCQNNKLLKFSQAYTKMLSDSWVTSSVTCISTFLWIVPYDNFYMTM